MTTYQNSFEGGSNGTGITIGNSGGASGDAFTAVDTSGTVTFSTTGAFHGTLGMQIVTGAAATGAYYAITGSRQAAMRCYYYVTSLPSAGLRVMAFLNSGLSSNYCAIAVSSAGVLTMIDNAGAVVATSAGSISAGTWYRLEMKLDNTTSGSQTANFDAYLGDGTSAISNLSLSANDSAVHGRFGGGNIATAYFGKQTGATIATIYYDDCKAVTNTTSYIGAAAATVTWTATDSIGIDEYGAAASIPTWVSTDGTGVSDSTTWTVAAPYVPGPPTTLVEIEFTAGVWTDISTSVQGDSIEIVVGKDSAAGDMQPGTLDLTVDNIDGTWTPDNPLSSLYPNLVEGKRIRVTVSKGSVSDIRFVGRLTSIVPDFPEELAQCETRLSAVDLLGELARMTGLPSMPRFAAESLIRSTSAGAYYPLTDDGAVSTFATGAVGSTATGVAALTPVRLSTAGEVSYASDDTAPGADGSCVALSTDAAITGTLPTSGLASVMVAAHLVAGQPGNILALGTRKPESYVSGVGWTQQSVVLTWDGSSRVTLYLNGSNQGYLPVTEGWHWVGADSTGMNIDGVSSGALGSASSLTRITLGGGGQMSFRDLVLNVTSYSGILFRSMIDTGASLAQITSDVQTMLILRGFKGLLAWSSPNGPTFMRSLPPATAGKNGLEVLAQLANSQSGIAFHNYSSADTQTVQLVSKADSRPVNPLLSVDIDGDGVSGPTVSRDVYGTLSSATVSNRSSSVTVGDAAASSDAASGSLEATAAMPNDVAAIASDRLAASKYNRLRVSEITIDLATAAHNLFQSFFGIVPGSRLRLTNLVAAYFGSTVGDGYVLGWKERPGVSGYQATFTLAAADAPAEGRFDDAIYGRYAAGGTMTLTSGITNAGTSVSITTAAGKPTLTTSAGAYPLDIVIDGERMTIASAPAGSSSPQTVTVTRGVAPTVAVAHSAGAPVEVWNAASYAL